MFHMDTQAPFLFDWKWLPPSGLSTKDFIAPSSFDFREKRSFGMGKEAGSSQFLFDSGFRPQRPLPCGFPRYGIQPRRVPAHSGYRPGGSHRNVKRKITDLDKMKIEEQKKAVRAGYDMDIIPSDLATYGGEAKKLLEDLQSRNERMFLITFLVMNTANNKKQLALNVKQAQSLAQQHNCQLVPLDFQQENGMGFLPAAGPQQNQNSARTDDLVHRDFHSFYLAGAVSVRRRGAVLRIERPFS